jgi:hypothetical protein
MNRPRLAIAISGLWRFSPQAIESLQHHVVAPLQRSHDVGVVIHAWADDSLSREEISFIERRLPVSDLQFEVPGAFAESAFDGSAHPHGDRYRSQWEGIARVFHLAARCAKPAAILRTRMDLVYLTPLRLPRVIRDNEIYICPVYNYMIASGLKIGIYEIPASAMHGLGTPEDLDAYLARRSMSAKGVRS